MYASTCMYVCMYACMYVCMKNKDKSGNQSGRKIKYVLLKHIQTNIFDQLNDLPQVQLIENISLNMF